MGIGNSDIVELRYNPYLPKVDIRINGIEIKSSSPLYKYRGEILQTWLYEIIDLLIAELNNDEFEIKFNGLLRDYEDLLEQTKEHQYITVTYNRNSDASVNLINQDKIKVQQVSDLVTYTQKSPIPEALRKEVKLKYDRPIEVAVLSTTSSGKSVLINTIVDSDSIIREDGICIPTIDKVKSEDVTNIFSVVTYDCGGNSIENNDISVIEEDRATIQSKHLNLALVDTPSFESYQGRACQEKIVSIIKDNVNKPLILYILNASQIGTNDESDLLNIICDEINRNDKQSQDRFIFILNQIDTINLQNQSLELVIQNARCYLENHGILNPTIYPTSANIANYICKKLKGVDLTSPEELDLKSAIDKVRSDENLHLLKYAPLSEEIKNNLEKDIQDCIEINGVEGELVQALYHSGIPYVKIAINKYLQKYAIPFKIQETIDVFREIKITHKKEQTIVLELEETMISLQKNKKEVQGTNNILKDKKEEIKQKEALYLKITDDLKLIDKKLNQQEEYLESIVKEDENLTQQVELLKKEFEVKISEINIIKRFIKREDADKFNKIMKKSIKKTIKDLTSAIKVQTQCARANSAEKIKYFTKEINCKKITTLEEVEHLIDQLKIIQGDILIGLDKEIEEIIKKYVDEFITESRKEMHNLFIEYEMVNVESTSIEDTLSSLWDCLEHIKYDPIQYVKQGIIIYDKSDSNYVKLARTRKILEKNLNNTIHSINEKINDIKVDFNSRIEKINKLLMNEILRYDELINESEQCHKIKIEEVTNQKERLKFQKDNYDKIIKKLELVKSSLTLDAKEVVNSKKEILQHIEFEEEGLRRLSFECKEIENKNKEIIRQKEFFDEFDKYFKEITRFIS